MKRKCFVSVMLASIEPATMAMRRYLEMGALVKPEESMVALGIVEVQGD